MIETVVAQKLTAQAFAPFGTVIQKDGSESFLINNGNCRRHHALAEADISGEGGAVIISIFSGQPYKLPLQVSMVERHPLGSQAFYPLGSEDWLVIVCKDHGGQPVDPRAFLATAKQGVNLKRNLWHGVLTPLHAPSDFLVMDRGGEGENLQEHHFETGFTVVLA